MEEASDLVRRVDEDRWLASRFAPAEQRAHLVAIYALNFEIAHAVESVTQAALGDIKLAWWREALEELAASKAPRAHPALTTYAPFFDASVLPHWRGIIDARGRDLEAAPSTDIAALNAYLDATAGGVMRLALAACGAGAPDAFIENAARAWGYAGLLRAQAHWTVRGRILLPAGVTEDAVIDSGSDAYAKVRASKPASHAFPAIGYLALTPRYYAALAAHKPAPSLFARQATLLVASLTF